jgi:hypothetical protein
MKKKTPGREKAAPVQDKDLVWVKGSSGYVVAYDEAPGDPPIEGGGTGGG